MDDLAAKILWAAANPAPVEKMVERGIQVYRGHLWQEEKARFLRHVAGLMRVNTPAPTAWKAVAAEEVETPAGLS